MTPRRRWVHDVVVTVITLFGFPLIVAYAPAAVWALRGGGLRRLWLQCVLALLAVALLALFVSAAYSVPSTWRVVLYLVGFVWPSMLLATGSLWLASGFTTALPIQLISALIGSVVGLVLGFLIVVYGLGIW